MDDNYAALQLSNRDELTDAHVEAFRAVATRLDWALHLATTTHDMDEIGNAMAEVRRRVGEMSARWSAEDDQSDERRDGLFEEDGQLVPFGRTPAPESGALVIVVPGTLPRPPIPNVSTAYDHETPEGRRLYAAARELATLHAERLPLRRLYSVWITYRTARPMIGDEFTFMVDVVSGALTEAGVIDDYSVYGESDFEIDDELGDAYSIEVHDLGQDRDHG